MLLQVKLLPFYIYIYFLSLPESGGNRLLEITILDLVFDSLCVYVWFKHSKLLRAALFHIDWRIHTQIMYGGWFVPLSQHMLQIYSNTTTATRGPAKCEAVLHGCGTMLVMKGVCV